MAGKGRGPQPHASKSKALQYFSSAQDAMLREDYDKAKDLFKSALKMDPNNVDILDACGSMLADLGQLEEARMLFRRAIHLSPDEGYEKYMYMGQLSEEEEAATSYIRKGIDILEGDLDAVVSSGKAKRVEVVKSQLCSALCSLAELHLSISQDLQGVEGEVEELLQRSLALQPDNEEALQALASFRRDQGRPEEALHLLRRSMSNWFKSGEDDGDEEKEEEEVEKEEEEEEEEEELRQGDGAMEDDFIANFKGKPKDGGDEDEEFAEAEDSEDEEEEELGPSYEFRIECAKLLLDLDETTEIAIQVLEQLIAENDQVPDVWYLLALSYYSGHQYEEAQEVMATAEKIFQQLQLSEDEPVVMEMRELRDAIKEALGETS